MSKVMFNINDIINSFATARLEKRILETLGNRKYVLFFGEKEPANAVGFWQMMGGSFGWMRPEHIILVAGSIAEIIDSYIPQITNCQIELYLEKVKKIINIENGISETLLKNASVIILPKIYDSVSNYETVRAISSMRPIVATSKACSGIVITKGISSFYVRDNPKEFTDTIRLVLSKQDK